MELKYNETPRTKQWRIHKRKPMDVETIPQTPPTQQRRLQHTTRDTMNKTTQTNLEIKYIVQSKYNNRKYATQLRKQQNIRK